MFHSYGQQKEPNKHDLMHRRAIRVPGASATGLKETVAMVTVPSLMSEGIHWPGDVLSNKHFLL